MVTRRKFIKLIGGVAAWPLASRASRLTGCGGSKSFCPFRRVTRKCKPAFRLSSRNWQSWDGPRAATFNSTSAGPRTMWIW